MGTSQRMKKREMKKNLTALLIIAVFAVIVFSVNSIGKFIAEKVIQPVMNLNVAKDERIVTNTVKIEALEIYGVGAGQFQDAASAEETVKKMKDGAGYVLETADGFTVLASCYTDKEWAESVKEKLSSSFDQVSVFPLKGDELSVKITGTKAQAELIAQAFSSLRTTVKEMVDLCVEADKGDVTRLQACTQIQLCRNDTAKQLEQLKALESGNRVVTVLEEMFTCVNTALGEMPESSDDAFAQKLKHASASLVGEYINFYTSLE